MLISEIKLNSKNLSIQFFFPNKENNNIVYISETLNLISGHLLSLLFLLGIHTGIKTLMDGKDDITAYKTISRDPML